MLLLSLHNDVQYSYDASTPVFAQVPDSFFPIVKTLPRHDSGIGQHHLDRKPTQSIANHYLLTPDTDDT